MILSMRIRFILKSMVTGEFVGYTTLAKDMDAAERNIPTRYSIIARRVYPPAKLKVVKKKA